MGLILGGELYVDLSGMNASEKAFEDGIAQLFDHINVRLRAIGAEENPSHPPAESRSPGRRSSERQDGGDTPRAPSASWLLWQDQAKKLKEREVRLRSRQQSPDDQQQQQEPQQLQDLVLARADGRLQSRQETVYTFGPSSFVSTMTPKQKKAKKAKKARAKAGRGNSEPELFYLRVADVTVAPRKKKEIENPLKIN